MKKNHIILSILLAGSMLSVASCTAEDTSLQTDNTGKVPLEIDVNVSKTRSIVEGTTLPGESSFGIFAPKGSNYETLVNGVNNKVYFDGTSCTSDKKIYLTEGVDIPVYAYYPYNNSYNSISYMNGEMSIEVESQTDYLYGYSSDTEGRLISQNVTNPKATILFKHAMSRVTINVKKAENNSNDYIMQKVSLSGIYTSANLLLKGDDDGRHVINANGNTSVGVKPMRGDVSSEGNNPADILAIPMDMSDRTVTLQLEFVGHEPMTVTIPSTIWKSGQQYTYNVTIENSKLSISSGMISSWNDDTSGNENINIEDNNNTASIGDIFYSDGTFSPKEISGKTPIGIVFALTDTKGGDINRNLRNSDHGRIIALQDLSSEYSWLAEHGNYTDIEGLPNFVTERAANITINSYGMIEMWSMVLDNDAWGDFNGLKNTQFINNEAYPAAYACCTYQTDGKEYGSGNWYLPSAGELKLISELFKKRIIYSYNQKCFTDMHHRYWTSTEESEVSAVVIDVKAFGDESVSNKKDLSNLYTRPASTF